jgi:hypothetical protein
VSHGPLQQIVWYVQLDPEKSQYAKSHAFVPGSHVNGSQQAVFTQFSPDVVQEPATVHFHPAFGLHT